MASSPSILGVGIDIVELKRVKDIKELRRFAEFFLTSEELKAFANYNDKITFIASRFALKEAVIKAFPGFLSPHDFRIAKRGVKPIVEFVASANEAAYAAHVSMTHSVDYAAGYATIVAR